MSVVYVDEYQPSQAYVRLGQDPIYKTSADDERIRIRRLAVPSPIGILIILGLIYLITRR
jgi:hypothetical protein